MPEQGFRLTVELARRVPAYQVRYGEETAVVRWLHDWPPLPRHLWGGLSRRDIWRQTFLPSEASLRLYYGIPVNRPLTLRHRSRHAAEVVARYVGRRLKD